MMRVAVLLVMVLPVKAYADPGALELDDVLESVRARHPLLEAARTAVERADGQVLAAAGAFDPRLRLRGSDVVSGYYDQRTLDGELSVLTTLWGAIPFVGWRLGQGAFPVYDGKAETLELGEVRAGISVPLLQGGRIDRARGERRKAELGRGVARAEVNQRELVVQRVAALAYFDWVAAAHRLGVRQAQFELARTRAAQLELAVTRGSRPAIDVVDNARLVASREALVVAARRDVRRTSLEVSLHLRAPDGSPIIPSAEPLPSLEPLAPAGPLDTDLEAARSRALEQAPRIAELARREQIIATDQDVARNAILPRLDLSILAVRGLGANDSALPDRSETSIAVGATFEVPIGMRAARGALQIANADQRRLRAERRFLIDQITADVAASQAELAAARERAELVIRGAELAEQVAAAERTRFDRGDSNLLSVNLREEVAAEAASLAIDARADVLRARVQLAVALGESP